MLRRGSHSCQSPAEADRPKSKPDQAAGSSATEHRVIYDISNYGSRRDVRLHHAMRDVDSEYDGMIYENGYLKDYDRSGKPKPDEVSEVYSSSEDDSHGIHSQHPGDGEYMDMSQRGVTYINGHDVLEIGIGVTGPTIVMPLGSKSPRS